MQIVANLTHQRLIATQAAVNKRTAGRLFDQYFGQENKRRRGTAKRHGAILVKLQEASVCLASAAITKQEGHLDFALSECNFN